MNNVAAKSCALRRRVFRVRAKLRSRRCVRLTVHSTGRHIYAQVIDDKTGITVVSASSCEQVISKLFKSGGNVEAASVVGRIVAERALNAGISVVVFDRGGRRFHGRIAAVANSARDTGIKF